MRRGLTLFELLIILVIFGVLISFFVVSLRQAVGVWAAYRAKSDVESLVAAVKAYQTTYGKMPTHLVSADDGQEAVQGWFQSNNNEIMQVLVGKNYGGLNSRGIVFLQVRAAKVSGATVSDGLGADNTFYDPWGTPYAIKLDTSYNNEVEYYGAGYQNNVKTTVFAVSFGKNKIQQNPGKTVDAGSKVDDIVSFR